jgi:L,D-peptidoglycan transpeptidase YkuD (ErfK/YbiS/YcfS/YnhG family)/uncharacterized protein YijF (DUF1287 family)
VRRGAAALLLLFLVAEARPSEAAPPLPDRGIFSDLDAQVTLQPAHDLVALGTAVVVDDSHRTGWLFAGAVPIAVAEKSPLPTVHVATLRGCDADEDGIPDPVDVLLGAKKTAIDAAPYSGGYYRLSYPGGDVPRNVGVCSDVIVRALRNAGLDLQTLVQEDRTARPGAYAGFARPDSNIDHRRVKTLLPWFSGHLDPLPIDAADSRDPWLPGDVVFLDTLPALGPDHIGILSDRPGASGRSLVVNSWTDGSRTAEMTLLDWVPVTHRFRAACSLADLRADDTGLSGAIARAGLALPPDSEQVLLVTSTGLQHPGAALRRYERTGAGAFSQVGSATLVNIGRAGLGWGRGIATASRQGDPQKREGDGRSPAGVFDLGTAFGYGKVPPARMRWPYRALQTDDVWIDDPDSPLYNTLQKQPAAGRRPWKSAEILRSTGQHYSLGIVVRHNDAPVVRGAGSAIFVHVAGSGSEPTDGCTSMDRASLVEILRWLDPGKRPVLVQISGSVFDRQPGARG